MARIDVDGLELDYELIGPADGPPLVITPGGRYPRDTAGVPELGQIMADAGYRVLLWDRPGCGASDIAFTAKSESMMNADALVGLVRRYLAPDSFPHVTALAAILAAFCLALAFGVRLTWEMVRAELERIRPARK